MKKIKLIAVIVITAFGMNQVVAQNTGITKSLGLYVFPTEEQDEKMQEADEAACYKWAIKQTGYDPLNPPEVVGATVDTSADGSAVKGAARGAAGGAAIGAIAGDAGKGAAIGAVVGGVRGRRVKKGGDAQQQQANDQAATAKSAELLADYKKAFSVCMEGKGYTIK
jgi:hypothetical protein